MVRTYNRAHAERRKISIYVCLTLIYYRIVKQQSATCLMYNKGCEEFLDLMQSMYNYLVNRVTINVTGGLWIG